MLEKNTHTSHISDKGLISGLYAEFSKLSSKKKKKKHLEHGQDRNRHFTIKDTQMTNKHMMVQHQQPLQNANQKHDETRTFTGTLK